MHILTKILVVAAAMFSVLLAALTMAYSVNADQIRSSFRDKTALAERASAEQIAQGEQYRQELGRQIMLREQAENDLAAMAETLALLQSNLSSERVERAKAEDEIELGRNEARLAGSTVQAMLKILGAIQGEVRTLRDEQLNFREREMALLDRNNELSAQLAVVEDARRLLAEQVNQLRNEVERLASGSEAGSSRANAGAMSNRPGRVVQARVTEVFKDGATGAMMARIEAGRNDGVREGTELTVHRDNSFLGNFVVIQADLQTALGRIDTLGRSVQVRAGDKVTSER